MVEDLARMHEAMVVGSVLALAHGAEITLPTLDTAIADLDRALAADFVPQRDLPRQVLLTALGVA